MFFNLINDTILLVYLISFISAISFLLTIPMYLNIIENIKMVQIWRLSPTSTIVAYMCVSKAREQFYPCFVKSL